MGLFIFFIGCVFFLCVGGCGGLCPLRNKLKGVCVCVLEVVKIKKVQSKS